MIRAFIFDLDGTLEQTEKLKASSYAVAVQRLFGLSQPDYRASETYWKIVGPSRDAASHYTMGRLAETVQRRIEEHRRAPHGG